MTSNHLVIIGGGIAGITCAESYCFVKPNDRVTILSCSPILKTVTNVQKISKVLESFEVFESKFTDIEFSHPNIKVTVCDVDSIDSKNRVVKTDQGDIKYDFLAICSGAKPNLIIKDSPFVIGIRDTDSIIDLKNRLNGAKRIVIVGNGGIALELVHEIKDCEKIWSIKDSHIGNAFFDREASQFLLHSKQPEQEEEGDNIIFENGNPNHHTLSNLSTPSKYKNEKGSALGPQWYSKYNFNTQEQQQQDHAEKTVIEYNTQLDTIYSERPPSVDLVDGDTKQWPVYIKLSNGRIYGCDFIVSATGVIPNSVILTKNHAEVAVSEDGGLVVDENMKTSIDRIYACGDVCFVPWKKSDLWFQMKLWSQARTMGRYTAQCIAKQSAVQAGKSADEIDEICSLFDFELFAHATKFFGFKVVLLGLYNGQTLGIDPSDDSVNENNDKGIKIYKRIIIGQQYVRIILEHGKLKGALLIGDTDLEETFENLILNQIDLSNYGEELLDPDIDIEDYFD
ncbi:hypothetical protein CYY_001528 [Polysphondylium violaceum]|uniref:Pyridine nucleotide-disulfide oxidoreductase domain-containing protein 1 n=1 Tax=Polysphondylium violaceum TaxID=133409 RepID=A0A8J4V422_9MYCE|nr:hypothetical protein CYY_001528 [Polysphondylium violaceum]